jgi:hypothetical protein
MVMGREKRAPMGLWACLLVLVVALAAGCGAGAQASEQIPDYAEPDGTAPGDDALTTTSTVPLAFDELSTFESKDPFVAKVVASVSKASAAPAGTVTTAPGTTPTTANPGSTTTTLAGQTTATTAPSKVTTALHSLKVLSIETVNEEPVVTFEVDDVVYQDRREAEVVSTSWGQVQVVEIDAEGQGVVLLHGSETRVLKVGQEFLK